MIRKGMKVFSYQGDSERTDIATVEAIIDYGNSVIRYQVSTENGDNYETEFVCPVAEMKTYNDGLSDSVQALMDYYWEKKDADWQKIPLQEAMGRILFLKEKNNNGE